jgi:hypothetical protein
MLLVCGACENAAPERDIDPANDPDAGESDADSDEPGPEFDALWREAPLYRSGSRLRARVIDGKGGAVAFDTFFDLELNTDCGFALSEDGKYRCLPGAGDGAIYYLDPQCSQPAFVENQSGTCKSTVAQFEIEPTAAGETCGNTAQTRVYRVGARRPDSFLYAARDGSCAPLGTFACVRELKVAPAESFVHGQRDFEAADHDVLLGWTKYDDGARVISGVRDAVRGADCGPDVAVAPGRCVPAAAAHNVQAGAPDAAGTLFKDDACGAAAVALRLASQCAPPVIAIAAAAAECNSVRYTMYTLGPAIDAAFAKTVTSCSKFAPGPGERLYELTDVVQPSALPALRLARAGSARLAVRYYATQDGQPATYDGNKFNDTSLSRPCEPQRMADNTLRCVPSEAIEIDATGPFLDDACTTRAAAMPIVPEFCNDVPAFGLRRNVRTGLVEAVQAVDEATTEAPEAVYFKAKDECRQRPANPARKYHALGSELDLAIVERRLD